MTAHFASRFSVHALGAVLLTATIFVADARADWILDGNPVCTAAGDQVDAYGVPDASGGIVVAWRDQRRGSSFFDLYATRVLVDGTIAPGWVANGTLLSQGVAGIPAVAPDDAGGVITVWVENYQVRMQHVLGSGALAPGFPVNGLVLPITVGGPAGYLVRGAQDGAGGAYVMVNRYTTYDGAYVTRVNGSGALSPGWTWDGVGMGGSSFALGWGQLGIAKNGSTGVLYSERLHIEDFIGASWDGFVSTRSANAGAGYFQRVVPTGHDGTYNGHDNVMALTVIPDDLGGAFAAWSTAGTPAGYFAQHYLANGTGSWPFATAAPVIDRLFADGAGGFYLLGVPYGGGSVQLHRRNADGSTPASWVGGRTFGLASPTSFFGVTGGNREYVIWASGGGASDDIRAIAYDGVGSLAANWHASGDVICDAPGQQALAPLVAGANNDALATWIDRRSGTWDVYVSRLATTGAPGVGVPRPTSAPTSLAIRRIVPNPAIRSAEILIASPSEDAIDIEVLDPSGRRVRAASVAGEAGLRSWTLTTQGLKGGLYFVRVRQGTRVAIQRISVLP